MTQRSPTQVADLRRKIEARYTVDQYDDGTWAVFRTRVLDRINDNDHDDPLDAEAEMEAIIQDEVKAAMEAEEDVT